MPFGSSSQPIVVPLAVGLLTVELVEDQTRTQRWFRTVDSSSVPQLLASASTRSISPASSMS